MKNGEDKVIYREHMKKIDDLQEQIRLTRVEMDRKLKRLENRCLEEHGSHKDDGAMFHGSCTRCGAFLG